MLNRMKQRIAAEYAAKSEDEVLSEFLAISIQQDRARAFALSPIGTALGVVHVACLALIPVVAIAGAMATGKDIDIRIIHVSCILVMAIPTGLFLQWPDPAMAIISRVFPRKRKAR